MVGEGVQGTDGNGLELKRGALGLAASDVSVCSGCVCRMSGTLTDLYSDRGSCTQKEKYGAVKERHYLPRGLYTGFDVT